MDEPEAEEARPARPEALGRWEPPPDSVVLRSGWRVDPERASGWYAGCLALAASLVAAWVVWRWPLLAQPPTVALEPGVASLWRAREAHRAAPFVVAAALLGFLGLGATKRCFGFDRGTLVGAGAAGATLLVAWSGYLGTSDFLFLLGVGAFLGFCDAAIALALPWGRSSRRRALAAAAYVALWGFAVLAARARFLVAGWPGEDVVAPAMLAAGAAIGTAALAIPWLLWAAASGSRAA